MMKKLHYKVLLLLALVSFGCKSQIPQSDSRATDRQAQDYREITDDLGRKIKLPLKVERAVSLSPNLTEIIFAVGAGDRLVGVTTYCDYPEQAKQIEKIGDTLRPSLEKIVALKPDVVFVSTASQLKGFADTLERNGITLFVTDPDSFEKIYSSIEKIGEIFQTEDQAKALVNQLKSRVEKVEQRVKDLPKPRVFVQIDKSLYTVGKNSFITDLVRKAGGISVTEELETDYPKLSKETALALNPEVIIITDSYDNNEPNEVFKNSDAVKNKRVYMVNADILSRPGPRIVDALEQVASLLHPESEKCECDK
ncbi:MAG: cobalamin-binding protein [Acidobacteria bacterium]|jgi:iron complex transport system substrate-binding protein|nr:MAG: cobalamin-binding protein [Acidobacteriota bacterium]GIU82469.1 MAG: ABC transporter substrate-binding protein [Pyrinomonadaceae bacterium]